MTDLEKMKKAIEFNGYRWEIMDYGCNYEYIRLEIVGYKSGHRLACFEFNKADGSFRLEE